MLKILENFLPGSYCEEIFNQCNTSNFPWFYFEKIDERYPESEWNKFYSHLIMDDNRQNSGSASFFTPIAFLIEEEMDVKVTKVSLLRIMMYLSVPENATVNRNKIELANSENCYVGLLFINDSDGEAMLIANQKGATKLLENGMADKKKNNIKGNQNTMIIFNDEYVLHDMFPKKSRNKIVMQMIFEAIPAKKEKDVTTV
jgi:hypothetical protein